VEPSVDVTVVIGAYNAMPYVKRCMQSVAQQTLGMDRLEVVAVDDGSTDGTGAVLDAFAAQHPDQVRVIHQANSGGPSAPRNRGLELATGRYVFFLDADDFLGDEALARMVAVADAEGSDAVLGRLASVNGRSVPRSMFRTNQPRTDVFASRIWWTLSACKLFRRSHVKDLRFPTEFRVGEDQMFTGRAFLTARVVSVVADYDCYHAVGRDDGGNLTATDSDVVGWMPVLSGMCALVAEHVEAGPRRDHLLMRQFGVDLQAWSGPRLLDHPQEVRDRVLVQAGEVIRTWGGDALMERLPALLRLRYHLLSRGLVAEAVELLRFEAAEKTPGTVAEEGSAYAAYPYWRDPAVGVPDSVFDITARLRTTHRLDALALSGSTVRLSGHAAVEELPDTSSAVEVLLRERKAGTEYRIAAQRDGDGFAVDLDLARAADGAPLPRGLWDVCLLITAQGIQREARFGGSRSDAVDTTIRKRVVDFGDQGPTVTTVYYTKPHGNLTFDVAEAAHKLGPIRVEEAHWERPGTLLLRGVADDEIADGALVLHVRGTSGELHDQSIEVRDGLFETAVEITGLTMGTWTISAELTLGSGAREVPVPLSGLTAGRWRRGVRVVGAKPSGRGKALQLRVAPLSVAAGLQRRLMPGGGAKRNA
jgi:hypothetical protein